MSYVDAVEPNPYGQSNAALQQAPAPPPPPPPAPAPPAATASTASTASTQARSRIGLVVLTAVLLEFLFIAAGDNQWVADKIVRDSNASLTDRILESSWLTYSWRFTHGRFLTTEQWGSQLLLVLTTLVVTGALVFVLLRGPVSWARAFFGTWLAVVFASLVAAFVRGLVAPDPSYLLPGTNRLMRSVFGSSGPSTRVVVASAALGLIVALVTSIVAVATRRSADAGAPAGPRTFPDYAPPPPGQQSSPPPWQDRVDQPTLQQPRPQEPSPPPPPAREAPQSSPPGQFPRPPDDEDLGHVDH